MTIEVYDRVQETTTTSGTGSITLNGAIAGFLSFAATVGVSNTTYYGIVDDRNNLWEIGIGTLTSSSVLSRDTVLSSSSSGAHINLAGVTARVFIDVPATKRIQLDSSVIGTAGTSVFYGDGSHLTGVATGSSYATLTVDDNGDTLDPATNLYFVFVNYGESNSVNLPDPSDATGKTLRFVMTQLDPESSFFVTGNIRGSDSSSWSFSENDVTDFVSDGTTWWVRG